jgi:hypothetical protein
MSKYRPIIGKSCEIRNEISDIKQESKKLKEKIADGREIRRMINLNQ